MSVERDSLLERAEAQGELFGAEDIERLAAMPGAQTTGEARECTAGHLFRDRPHIYKMIVYLTAEGLGQLRIREITGVHTNTIAAVQEREGSAVEMVKQRISKLARSGAQICIEGIVEKINDPEQRKKMSGRDLAIIAGVLIDKAELLSGGATSRVEIMGGESPVGFADYINSLPAALVDEAGVGSTSKQGGISGQRDGAALGAGVVEAGQDGADAGAAQPGRDGAMEGAD